MVSAMIKKYQESALEKETSMINMPMVYRKNDLAEQNKKCLFI